MFIILVLLIALAAIFYLANDPSALKKLKELSAQPGGKDTKVKSTSMPVKTGKGQTSTKTALVREDTTQHSKSKKKHPEGARTSPTAEELRKQAENLNATTPNTAIPANDVINVVTKNNSYIPSSNNNTFGRKSIKEHHQDHSKKNL